MKDQDKYGFYLTESQGDYIALKSNEDGDTAIKLVVNKDFLKGCKNPLSFIRLLELIFKSFLRQAQDEK
ncbi:MAG: hypothetical protein HOU59_gp80 (endogenous virus) [Lactobacillus phage ViSo-2018a]|uniref:Uncharacterized protein n=1 Tax=Lactobacillus phage ViSo-2018a TaxID=2267607 RepID=A0A3G6JKZ9_9CAUD|nr:MAG: hypothetical protein HOU59_gp80 [Lactobacillus phage ViSo-2018a]AZA17310.1 MAG: hypothetical protein DQL93_0655 [Lactobacillus phage ViSo-2018a]